MSASSSPKPSVKKARAARKPATPPATDVGASQAAALLARMSKVLQRSPLRCADGTRLSAQANEFTYCEPRNNEGPYQSVEVGFPSRELADLLPWAEEPSNPTGTVYGRVPVLALAFAIASCGGRDARQKDWSCHGLEGGPRAREEPVSPGPIRLAASGPASAWIKALEDWAQQAALGSPAREWAARFEVWDKKELVLGFEDCMGCMLQAGFEKAASGDLSAWARLVDERVQISKAAKPGRAPARRSSI